MIKQKFQVKIADQPWELEEVCRLNHQTFSEEIEQHEKTSDGLLIDKFHSENQYFICLDGQEIAGMLAIRNTRPFSLDYKLDNLDSYLPPYNSLYEIRLLTVKPNYRNSIVLFNLFKSVSSHLIKEGCDIALISGFVGQQRLYRSIGCVPFGPLVGDTVKFQPMYLSPDYFLKARHRTLALRSQQKRINALPGPVEIKDVVSDAFKNKPYSHRSDEFIQNYQDICRTLCSLVNTQNVQIFTGSATLANEIMIAHFSALNLKGLMVSNGEFGDRITHQAQCQKLNYTEYKVPMGCELSIDKIKEILVNDADIKWLTMVHCETSLGVINDLEQIVNICNKRDIKVIVDCVSSIGIIPLDLNSVYMASASSGKALGSYAGLSMIFYNNLQEVPAYSIPVYLDIWHYINKNGVPFTLNSNALNALGAAVEVIDVESRFTDIKRRSDWLKKQLVQIGFNIIPDIKSLHPAIITIQLPETTCSATFGKLLEKQGVLINYNSEYLIKQNTVQICLFSDLSDEDTEYFFDLLNSTKNQIENN
ncbi:MAG: aminotransferase class V-fold PLP-dependent enzyme [Bacteroidota bacterium]